MVVFVGIPKACLIWDRIIFFPGDLKLKMGDLAQIPTPEILLQKPNLLKKWPTAV